MALTICTEKMTVMVSEFPKDWWKSLFAGDVRQFTKQEMCKIRNVN